MSGPGYAELQVTSHFSFLRGTSSCNELFATAAMMGVEALAIVDRNSLAGVVGAREAAKTTGVRLVVGCRVDLSDGLSVLVSDRSARLCAVALRPMTAGSEVVEDYGYVGLTLRQHPVAFLRTDIAARRIVTCTAAMQARDGRCLEAAGLVLVRQRPGSAKGVIFITLEDETGIANLAVWPQVFEKFRRVVMGASMIAVHGRIQREGEVVHLLVAQRLTDLCRAGLGRQPRSDLPAVAWPRRPGHPRRRRPRSTRAAAQRIAHARHLYSRPSPQCD
jgi:DNA polymerase III alpha subunit